MPATARSRLSPALLAGGLLAAAIALPPGEAAACSCMQAPAELTQQQLAELPLVFSGRAIGRGGNAELAVTYFQVERVLKGEAPAILPISSPTSSAACGVEFALGQSYNVIAHPPEPGGMSRYHGANICSQMLADLAVRALAGQ